jgi:hypothetical protein
MDTRNGRGVASLNRLDSSFEALILPVKIVPRALILNWRSRYGSLPIQVQEVDGKVLTLLSEGF